MATSYRELLHEIAQELSPENIRNIVFLSNWKGLHSCRSTCCADTSGCAGNLDVLSCMWEQRVFSESDMEPLIRPLKVIGRNDLASKCVAYRKESQQHRVSQPAGEMEPCEWPQPHTQSRNKLPALAIGDDCTTKDKPLVCASQKPQHVRGNSLDDTQLLCTCQAAAEDQPTRQRSISTPPNYHSDEVESDFSPSTLTDNFSFTTSAKSDESALKLGLATQSRDQHRQQLMNASKPSNRDSGFIPSPSPRPTSTSTLSSETDDSESSPIPSNQFNHTVSGGGTAVMHPIPHRRHTTGSLCEVASCYEKDTMKTKRRVTFNWKLCRSDFIDPLFNHNNRIKFVKRCKYSSGIKSSTNLNIHFNVVLIPNGINWDQDSFSTLKVQITKTSRSPPSTAFLKFHITGSDCTAGHVICSRQVEFSFGLKEFVIQEFLAHEVIKESRAKHFEFKISVEVCYHSLLSEWEIIDNDLFY